MVEQSPSARIGMLTPSSNTVVEPVSARLVASLDPRLTVHFARVPVITISEDAASDRQFDPEPMLWAAKLLADARVDIMVWNGTSGAWQGLERDRALVERIRSEVGCRATTATLSLLDALHALHIRRYGLVVPYVDAITRRIKGTLGVEGFECVAATNESVTVNADFADIGPDVLAERVRTVSAAKPDAIVIHCTNLRGAEVVERLERELGIPVLDSVLVAFWGALRALPLDVPIQGFGYLLAGKTGASSQPGSVR